MRSVRRIAALPIAALPIVALLTAACGNVADIEADLTPEILSGDWEATTVQITNLANPAQTLDLLEQGGELSFRFTLDGNATQFLTLPGEEEPEVSEATYEIDSPYLIFVDETEEPQIFAYELQSTQTGNSLTLATNDLLFDFDGDGTPEPALFAVVIIR